MLCMRPFVSRVKTHSRRDDYGCGLSLREIASNASHRVAHLSLCESPSRAAEILENDKEDSLSRRVFLDRAVLDGDHRRQA